MVLRGRIRARRAWAEWIVEGPGRVGGGVWVWVVVVVGVVGVPLERAAMLIMIWKVMSFRGSMEWMSPREQMLVVEVVLVALLVRRVAGVWLGCFSIGCLDGCEMAV